MDRAHAFIGSLNMDQRSKLLNTEMGVIIDSAPLAKAVKHFFDSAVLPENAFHVVLQKSQKSSNARMTWLWREGGKSMRRQSDPGASTMRRLEVLVMSWLPIEGLL